MVAPLAHDVAGDGPPLLLLNGGLMSLRAWDPVASRLQARFTVVRCDLRGQLLSPGPTPATLAGHADDVGALLDYLGLGRVHVAGASFGALVGLTFAAHHLERVATLTAMVATDRITPEMSAGGRALADACRVAAEGGDGGRVFDLIEQGTFSPEYRRAHADELKARRQAISLLPHAWFSGLVDLLATLDGLDLRPLLTRITCPTLVLGAGHDVTFPVFHSQELARRLPDAHLRIIPEAAHGVVLEEPDVVTESIIEFIETAGSGPAVSPEP
jgi:pimeloyl-ACP methyl ester carboxylesterase